MEIKINGKVLSLSQSEDGTKLLGRILICPLDESNLNGKGIKESDLSESELKTLIGQPLVGKVVKDENDEYDFSGHNLKKLYEYNSKTNSIEIKYTFDTVPIGYFTSAEIEDIEINGSNKRCIVADVEIWKRYERATEVILNRFESGNLGVSWELDYGDKYESDGITWLKEIVFIGVAVLGEKVQGAYVDAGFLEVSELEEHFDTELIGSLTEDIMEELSTSSIENTNDDIDNINLTNNQGGKKDMSENIKDKKNDIASLTDNDLYTRVRQAINSANPNDWYYISYLFPYEYKAIAHRWEDDETSFVEFKYSVNSDDSVSITSQSSVKMQFVLTETIEEKETQISELTAKLSEKESELSTKLDEIIKLGEEISAKDTVISELNPIKEQFEASEKEKQEAEIAEKKETLKAYATKGGYISQEEIETSEEIKNAIENLDENFIKNTIADRVMASIDKQAEEIETSGTETSTVNTQNISTNLNVDESIEEPSEAFMKAFGN